MNPSEMPSPVRRILLVEDETTIALLLKALLEGEFEVDLLSTPEAIQSAELMRPDVVITDYSMPVMDGMTVTHIVRQRWPEAKVILISGKPVDGKTWQDDECRPDSFLAKPFKTATLKDEILRLLEGNGDDRSSKSR